MTPVWIPYEETKWDRQPLPPERRFVLVRTWPTVRDGLVRVRDRTCTRPAIAVGYMKFGAGCEDSPYFVIPSVGGEVVAWADCLGDEAQPNGILWEVTR